MSVPSRTLSKPPTRSFAPAWNGPARMPRPVNAKLNTLDEVLDLTRSYSAEIRQDAKARRIYSSFVALTHSQFEALLAFSLWKVRNLPLAL